MEVDVRKSGEFDTFRWADGDDDNSGIVRIYDDSCILVYDSCGDASLEIPVCEIPNLIKALKMALESDLTQSI